MSIDDLKKYFDKQSTGVQKKFKPADHKDKMGRILKDIKKIDRDDRMYLIKHRFIPLAVGLAAIILILPLVFSTKNLILLIGTLLILLSVGAVLALSLRDFSQIARESFGVSMVDFLNSKEHRLKKWNATRLGYYLAFIVYQIGLLMMILANKTIVGNLSTFQLVVFLSSIYTIIITCWILGERYFRKRHRQKHQPLIKMIEEVKSDLSRDATR